MNRSLFIFHCPANTGYAMVSLETLFLNTGLALADNQITGVHFGFPGDHLKLSSAFPPDFSNTLQYDIFDTSKANIKILTNYIKKHQIDLVVLFDVQPIHKAFKYIRKAGVSTIISYWGASIASVSPLWKRALKWLFIMLSRSKVDSLIFESEIMGYHATHGRGVPRNMIDIVPLGVDTQKFRPGKSTYVHETLIFPQERKVFVYSGHMERRKGVHIIIEAAIELLVRRNRKDVCFLLCGNKGNESEPHEKLYEDLELDDFIKFGGYRNDLPEIYRGSYCGIIASTGWDSFTYCSIEMASSGLPVIASRLQGLAEAVVDKKTGLLFEPGNAQMLADCIEKLLDNPDLATEYGKQGRLRCENNLSYAHQEHMFLDVVSRRLRSTQVK